MSRAPDRRRPRPARKVPAVTAAGMFALAGGCVRHSDTTAAGARCVPGPGSALDAALPFDFAEGEPLIARYYTYPYGRPQPVWTYRPGWDELGECLGAVAPGLPAPARTFNILALAQTMARAITLYGNDATIQDLLRAGAVPESLQPAGPVQARDYLGALLRCAEQGRLIFRSRG